jgi:hypothetical protein
MGAWHQDGLADKLSVVMWLWLCKEVESFTPLPKIWCSSDPAIMTPLVFVSQCKMQFCTLLQVPIRLCSDSRNLSSFTASLQLQQTTECSGTVMKIAVLHIAAGPYQAVLLQQYRECSCTVTETFWKYFMGCNHISQKHSHEMLLTSQNCAWIQVYFKQFLGTLWLPLKFVVWETMHYRSKNNLPLFGTQQKNNIGKILCWLHTDSEHKEVWRQPSDIYTYMWVSWYCARQQIGRWLDIHLLNKVMKSTGCSACFLHPAVGMRLLQCNILFNK